MPVEDKHSKTSSGGRMPLYFYKFLADGVAVIHLLMIILLLAGTIGLLTGIMRKFPRWQRFHVSLLIVTMVSQLIFLGCPLTILENALRFQYNPATSYFGSFVVHYLLTVAGIHVSAVLVTMVFWAFFVVIALVYLNRKKLEKVLNPSI